MILLEKIKYFFNLSRVSMFFIGAILLSPLCLSAQESKFNNNHSNWTLIVGIVWWLLCIVIEPHLREKIDGHNFPTKASFIVRWMGILGFIVVLGIGLFLKIFNRSIP